MKKYELIYEQLNGQMRIFLEDEDSPEPIFWARSVAPSQWDGARKELLISGLRDIANQLERKPDKITGLDAIIQYVEGE